MKKLRIPVMLIYVLPDVTHDEMFMSPALVPTALPFLDGESGARSWAEQVKQGK